MKGNQGNVRPEMITGSNLMIDNTKKTEISHVFNCFQTREYNIEKPHFGGLFRDSGCIRLLGTLCQD